MLCRGVRALRAGGGEACTTMEAIRHARLARCVVRFFRRDVDEIFIA